MAQNGSTVVKDWRRLAEEAIRETDATKLHCLVEELFAALDEREKFLNQIPSKPQGKWSSRV